MNGTITRYKPLETIEFIGIIRASFVSCVNLVQEVCLFTFRLQMK